MLVKMRVEDFLRNRKLRKITPDKNKAVSGIKVSESKLGDAKKLFDADFYEQSILAAYTSMFHAARGLLYKDGMQEKSHYAVYIYLEEKYGGKIPLSLIKSFLNHQNERKEILYGLERRDVYKEDAESAVLDAEEFLEKIKELFKENGGI